MAISQETLAQIINKNKNGLCSPQGDRLLNEYKGIKNSQSTDIDPNSFSDEWDTFSFTDEEKPVREPQYDEVTASKCKMPEAIKESMLKHRIDTQPAIPMPQKRENKSVVREAVAPQTAIDYNYIKYLIKECLEEYFAKQSINENATLKQIGLSEGKIKLVDNKGNVFSADLSYKGNVNNRKK